MDLTKFYLIEDDPERFLTEQIRKRYCDEMVSHRVAPTGTRIINSFQDDVELFSRNGRKENIVKILINKKEARSHIGRIRFKVAIYSHKSDDKHIYIITSTDMRYKYVIFEVMHAESSPDILAVGTVGGHSSIISTLFCYWNSDGSSPDIWDEKSQKIIVAPIGDLSTFVNNVKDYYLSCCDDMWH